MTEAARPWWITERAATLSVRDAHAARDRYTPRALTQPERRRLARLRRDHRDALADALLASGGDLPPLRARLAALAHEIARIQYPDA